MDWLQRETLRGYSILARWAVGWGGVNVYVCMMQRFGAIEAMHTDTEKSSLICRLSAEMTAFTSSTDSPAYCQQPWSSSITTSPFFSSPVVFTPLGTFFHHKVITESLFPTFYVSGHLPPPLICKLHQRLSQQMWAYWRSVLTTRVGCAGRSPDWR